MTTILDHTSTTAVFFDETGTWHPRTLISEARLRATRPLASRDRNAGHAGLTTGELVDMDRVYAAVGGLSHDPADERILPLNLGGPIVYLHEIATMVIEDESTQVTLFDDRVIEFAAPCDSVWGAMHDFAVIKPLPARDAEFEPRPPASHTSKCTSTEFTSDVDWKGRPNLVPARRCPASKMPVLGGDFGFDERLELDMVVALGGLDASEVVRIQSLGSGITAVDVKARVGRKSPVRRVYIGADVWTVAACLNQAGPTRYSRRDEQDADLREARRVLRRYHGRNAIVMGKPMR